MWPNGEGPSSMGNGRASTGSEVMIVNDMVAAAANEVPSIASMNIHRSPGTHIGHKFVTVSQTVHNNDVIKGRLLGLELVSPAHNKRLRCCVAVFVCWALVVASGLAIYFFYFTLYKEQTRHNLGLNETWYLRRPDWQAQAPSSTYTMEFLRLPVKFVMIGHSALDYCSDKRTCITEVRKIQNLHIERFGDIGPNFLVGGNGLVFEGAGANVVGATIPTWNYKMIAIMFLGNYSIGKCTANQTQIDNVKALLEELVKENILDSNYILYGYCQILTYTVPPGWNIMERLRGFKHWRSDNATTCRKED